MGHDRLAGWRALLLSPRGALVRTANWYPFPLGVLDRVRSLVWVGAARFEFNRIRAMNRKVFQSDSKVLSQASRRSHTGMSINP